MSKLAIAAEFWQFMRVRKKYWLGPIVFIMLLLGALIILTEGSALAPFIYDLLRSWVSRTTSHLTFDVT